ncbi:MAG: VOC family protein [Alphaproteobacteria bacterium]
MTDSPKGKPRLLGINHVALEVGDIDQALAFYGRFFEFELRGRSEKMAFIDLGDQFLALIAGREQPTDSDRHFGLVVDDREGLRARLEAAGVELVDEKRLDFLDPWGNRIEVVPYREIQFLKDRAVLRALGAETLRKTDAARDELRAKGIAPGGDA